MPVATRTTKAGQASRAKARASTLGASAPRPRAGPTRPSITIWPPTQIAAARTWRVSRTVSSAGASMESVLSFRSCGRPAGCAPAAPALLALLALPLGGALLGEGGRPLHGVG